MRFELRSVAWHGDQLGQRRVGIERQGLDVRVNLQARAAGIIHQEQASAIIGGEIAGADVLPVAAIVGEGQRVDHRPP